MAVALPRKLYYAPDNSLLITVDGLFDKGLNSYFDATATVKAWLLDSTGSVVAEVNGVAMNYVAASNGSFQAQVLSAAAQPLGPGYMLKIQADQGGAHRTVWEEVEVALSMS